MRTYTLHLTIRSYECDSYGHVNNATYLNYLEYARMMALEENNFTLDKMKENGYMVVIRRIEIEYKLPLYMNEKVLIKTSLSHAKNSSGTFHQQILDEENKQIAAEAWVTWVFTNLKGRPIPIPDEIRQAFEIK